MKFLGYQDASGNQAVWSNSADVVHGQKGRKKWEKEKCAWLDNVAVFSPETEYAQKSTSQNLN